MADVEAFIKERDEALLSGDVDQVMAFHDKHNLPRSVSREVVEIAMHKARTAAMTLPVKARLESKRWLDARGMSSLDDGELTDAS